MGAKNRKRGWSRRARRNLRAFPWLGAAVILPLGALAIPSLGGFASRESGSGDYDLRLLRRPVEDRHNGFFILADGPPVYWPEDSRESAEAYRLSTGSSSNWKLAEEILAKNPDLLQHLDESLRERDFQFPQLEEPVSPISVTATWRDMITVVSIAAFLHAEQSGTEAGLNDAMKILRFAQRVQGAQGGLVQWLMGSQFKRQALVCIRGLSLRADVGSRQLVALSRELERFAADREGFADAVRFEYGSAVGEVDELHPEATRQKLIEVMRKAIRCATRERAWGIQVALEVQAGSPNVCARAADGWHLGLEDGAMEDTALAATRAILALRAFDLENGRMARSLAELVPVYLPAFPVDPFDGRPLRYSPADEIVYSVGADLRDDGGSPMETPATARQDRNEPTFRY